MSSLFNKETPTSVEESSESKKDYVELEPVESLDEPINLNK
jgi:hypothetical protein